MPGPYSSLPSRHPSSRLTVLYDHDHNELDEESPTFQTGLSESRARFLGGRQSAPRDEPVGRMEECGSAAALVSTCVPSCRRLCDPACGADLPPGFDFEPTATLVSLDRVVHSINNEVKEDIESLLQVQNVNKVSRRKNDKAD